MKKSAIVVVLSVLVVVLAIWAVSGLFSNRPVREHAPNPVVERNAGSKLIAEEKLHKRNEPRRKNVGEDSVGKKSRQRGEGAKTGVKRLRVKVEDPYTPEERKLADKLQDASDDNDLDKIRKSVEEIVAQKNPELKQEAISTLGFFGKAALTDLMAFLKDPNLEVVDAAADAISRALQELDEDDKAFKAEFITTLLSIKGLCNKDAVEGFAGQLESLGSDDEMLAVQTIVNLLEANSVEDAVKTRLKEAYEFVTSEEYTTFEAAEKWYNDKTAEKQGEMRDELEEAAEAAEDGSDSDEKAGEDNGDEPADSEN